MNKSRLRLVDENGVGTWQLMLAIWLSPAIILAAFGFFQAPEGAALKFIILGGLVGLAIFPAALLVFLIAVMFSR